MNSSIVVSGDTEKPDVYPVISTIRRVIVDLRHRCIVGSRLLYVISVVNTKRGVYRFLTDLSVEHLYVKAYIKGWVTCLVKHSLKLYSKVAGGE